MLRFARASRDGKTRQTKSCSHLEGDASTCCFVGSDSVRPVSKRRAHSIRKSTVDWIRQFHKRDEFQRNAVNKMKSSVESSASTSTEKSDEDENRPINILVLEGGGLRGHAHIGLFRGLCEKNSGEDVLQYFDLVGGTSVGGVAALQLNQKKPWTPIEDFLRDCHHVLKQARERTFKNINWFNLLHRGSLTKNKDNSLASVLRNIYEDTPLYNPDGVKAFALCGVRKQKEGGIGHSFRRNSEGSKTMMFEPFLARTYDVMPSDDMPVHTAGSNSMFLWEAMAATSAVPALVDRVEISVDGQLKRFADGGVFANNPIAIAIMEAKQLWPNRPLGTIAAFCLTDTDTQHMMEAVIEAKQVNPGLQFVPLRPPFKVAVTEAREAKILEIEEDSRRYITSMKESMNCWAN